MSLNDKQILNDLDALVHDELKVISFKWLTRAYATSSVKAQRILQQYVDSREGRVEATFVVSGWTKQDPRSFSTSLASTATLEEVRGLLDDAASVHVYSVSKALPVEEASLWGEDFIRAESLYNQPQDVENCQRDNRFSAVLNPGIVRNPSRRGGKVPKAPASASPAPQKGASNAPKAHTPATPPAPHTVAEKEEAKVETKTPSPAQGSLVHESTEEKKGGDSTPRGNGAGGGVKKKTDEGRSGGFMWFKAPTKSRAEEEQLTEQPQVVPTGTVSTNVDVAVARKAGGRSRIGKGKGVEEAEEGGTRSEIEDGDAEMEAGEEFTALRAGRVGEWSGAARRRVVEEEEEEEEEKEKGEEEAGRDRGRGGEEKSGLGGTGAIDCSDQKKENVGSNGGADVEEEAVEVRGEGQGKPAGVGSDSGRGAGVKRKQQVTKLDEKGREVTQSVWVNEMGEEVEPDSPRAPLAKKVAVELEKENVDRNRPTAAKAKPVAPPLRTAQTKPPAKKGGKATVKGQGTIASFFKPKS